MDEKNPHSYTTRTRPTLIRHRRPDERLLRAAGIGSHGEITFGDSEFTLSAALSGLSDDGSVSKVFQVHSDVRDAVSTAWPQDLELQKVLEILRGDAQDGARLP